MFNTSNTSPSFLHLPTPTSAASPDRLPSWAADQRLSRHVAGTEPGGDVGDEGGRHTWDLEAWETMLIV